MPRSARLSDRPGPVRPTGSLRDAVAAVHRAHHEGRPLALPTSGTTGDRREVLRTTDSWWRSFDAYSALSVVDAGAWLWIPGPAAATMNLFAGVHALAVGASLADSPADATHACLTPALLARRGDELPRGVRVVVAGDRLGAAAAEAAESGGLSVAHYYGAAELSFVASGRHADDLRPFPGAEVEIREGEIWVRSPYLAEGYLGSPGPLRHDGGWAGVGDRGRLDGDRLVVLGRPDAVITAGATVLVAEVERTLGDALDAPVAVVAVPHPTMGALVGALIAAGDLAEAKVRARALLPVTHRPRVWRVVPALPLTGAGKLDRPAAARMLADEHPDDA